MFMLVKHLRILYGIGVFNRQYQDGSYVYLACPVGEGSGGIGGCLHSVDLASRAVPDSGSHPRVRKAIHCFRPSGRGSCVGMPFYQLSPGLQARGLASMVCRQGLARIVGCSHSTGSTPTPADARAHRNATVKRSRQKGFFATLYALPAIRSSTAMVCVGSR
jgi:hypothetical protein